MLRSLRRAAGALFRISATLVTPLAVPLFAFAAHGPFDRVVTQASPAFAYPNLLALPFYLPAFALLGAMTRLWVWYRSIWVFLTVMIGYFVVFLGGMCDCQVYQGPTWHREALWELIGEPSEQAIAVGLLCAATACAGWTTVGHAWSAAKARWWGSPETARITMR